MDEEPNGCDSDSDVDPKNYLNTYNDVEIEDDEFWSREIQFLLWRRIIKTWKIKLLKSVYFDKTISTKLYQIMLYA